MVAKVRARYQSLVEAGQIERDLAQEALVDRFVQLNEALKSRELASKKSSLGWLFAKSAPPKAPNGLYIWGGVGRGKTMLMDLLYEETPVQQKQRWHFHAFMAEMHERIHAEREQIKTSNRQDGDPIGPVADSFARGLTLLCFDEFYVVDIADAMILGRLFERLFQNGVTLVATSNVEPSGLYPDGLNRDLFLPFIAMLQAHVDVIELRGRTDFRLEKLAQGRTYFTPIDEEAKAGLDEAWRNLTGSGVKGASHEISIKGRSFKLPQASMSVARARFADLCEQPLGASDYLMVARDFHTLILDDVPQLSRETANAARRFINLIDALYEYRVKLILSAEVLPPELYKASGGHEAFAFDRTVSRLIEMQSQSYLALPHGRMAL